MRQGRLLRLNLNKARGPKTTDNYMPQLSQCLSDLFHRSHEFSCCLFNKKATNPNSTQSTSWKTAVGQKGLVFKAQLWLHSTLEPTTILQNPNLFKFCQHFMGIAIRGQRNTSGVVDIQQAGNNRAGFPSNCPCKTSHASSCLRWCKK